MEHISVGTSGWVGLHPKEYARQFDTVEFNWTFHEREDSVEQFQKAASEVASLRLQAVLKVSGLATHENRLRHPESWWPGLWAKYSKLHDAGVLGGLLWQLAPSFRCSLDTLRDLETLAGHLPRNVLNIFEFRHSSWYDHPRVLELLRRHRFCLAWINIVNEDGWCGDLSSGWPSMHRTCDAVYFRMFGTKRKAVGRYSEEFLRREVLPHLEGGRQAKTVFVVFAQADVPDHAKADAAALMDLCGRTSVNPSRSTRWERDVLVASLGLRDGTVVDGVVQRVTHRTILVDIGRSCRATLCAHHARRVGLLENLHVGTELHGLVVESIDFQNEWGLVGLTCYKAVIGSLGGDLSVADPNAISIPDEAAPSLVEKKMRWTKSHASEAMGSKEAACGDGPGSQPEPSGLPKITTAPSEGSNADSEAANTKRWGRQKFPPAAMKRELEALERAEARKGQTHIYLRLGRAKRPRNVHSKQSRMPRMPVLVPGCSQQAAPGDRACVASELLFRGGRGPMAAALRGSHHATEPVVNYESVQLPTGEQAVARNTPLPGGCDEDKLISMDGEKVSTNEEQAYILEFDPLPVTDMNPDGLTFQESLDEADQMSIPSRPESPGPARERKKIGINKIPFGTKMSFWPIDKPQSWAIIPDQAEDVEPRELDSESGSDLGQAPLSPEGEFSHVGLDGETDAFGDAVKPRRPDDISTRKECEEPREAKLETESDPWSSSLRADGDACIASFVGGMQDSGEIHGARATEDVIEISMNAEDTSRNAGTLEEASSDVCSRQVSVDGCIQEECDATEFQNRQLETQEKNRSDVSRQVAIRDGEGGKSKRRSRWADDIVDERSVLAEPEDQKVETQEVAKSFDIREALAHDREGAKSKRRSRWQERQDEIATQVGQDRAGSENGIASSWQEREEKIAAEGDLDRGGGAYEVESWLGNASFPDLDQASLRHKTRQRSSSQDLCAGPGDHRAKCCKCSMEYFLDVELGADFSCSCLGLDCSASTQVDRGALEVDRNELSVLLSETDRAECAQHNQPDAVPALDPDVEEDEPEDEEEDVYELEDDDFDEDGVDEDNEELELEDDADIFVAVCDLCGATHLMDVDIMSLGVEFTCGQLGFECEGAEPTSSSSTAALGDSQPVLPPRSAKLEALTMEEKKDLFRRHAQQLQVAKMKKKDIHKGVQQLFDKQAVKERFRDSEVVTRKGERFIKINISLDPGPGCELGGILGWRSKMGRRGLGIRKMTKEEADRVCLSNKNRFHERKTTTGGGLKGYTFENKWSSHTAGSLQGTAPKTQK